MTSVFQPAAEVPQTLRHATPAAAARRDKQYAKAARSRQQ